MIRFSAWSQLEEGLVIDDELDLFWKQFLARLVIWLDDGKKPQYAGFNPGLQSN